MRAGENTGDLDRPCGSKICRRAELGRGGQRFRDGASLSATARKRKGRRMHTTNAEYFRRQAATCLRLAQVCRDLDVARGLFGLAHEFKSKAAEIDRDLQPMPRPSLGQSSDAA
jgi:hypothetical protein